jgi:hypothetical protein
MKHLLYAALWALLAGFLFAWGDRLAANGELLNPGPWCFLAISLPGVLCLRQLLRWRNL